MCHPGICEQKPSYQSSTYQKIPQRSTVQKEQSHARATSLVGFLCNMTSISSFPIFIYLKLLARSIFLIQVLTGPTILSFQDQTRQGMFREDLGWTAHRHRIEPNIIGGKNINVMMPRDILLSS